MSLLFYLFSSATNLWHRKFITADVTAMFVNNRHGIQWPRQDFDKKRLVFEGAHRKYCDRQMSWEKLDKAWWKSCETRAQMTRGQAVADRAVKRK